MNKNNIIALLALVFIIGGGWYLYTHRAPKLQIFDSNAAVKQLEANDRTVGIEEYVKRNVSGLSAEAGFPEQVGGTFQVTSFSASAGKGTASYEDGHNAYTAEFTYTTDKKGLVTVTSFTAKKK